MTDDTRQLLRDAAPTPSAPVDVDRLWQRARRQRRAIRSATAAGSLVAVVAVASLLAGLPGSGPGVEVTDRPGGCPVTDVSGAFVPPAPYSPEPSIKDAVWFGTPQLWTVVPTDPSLPRKSVWWSIDFEGGGVEPRPDVEVVYERLDDPGTEPVVVGGPGTNAYTDVDGWFMIAGHEPTEPGCWRATATYRETSLSYVYLATDGASEPGPATVTGPTLTTSSGTAPFPWVATLAPVGTDRWCLTPAIGTTTAVTTAPGEPCEHLVVPDPPRGSRSLTHAGTRVGQDGEALRWGIVPPHHFDRGQISVTRADGTEVEWLATSGSGVPFGVWFAATTGEAPTTVTLDVDGEVVDTVTIVD